MATSGPKLLHRKPPAKFLETSILRNHANDLQGLCGTHLQTLRCQN